MFRSHSVHILERPFLSTCLIVSLALWACKCHFCEMANVSSWATTPAQPKQSEMLGISELLPVCRVVGIGRRLFYA